MKIDNDRPSRVNGVALTLEKYAGCQISTSTITDASRVTNRLRKAMRLAIEPLRENNMPSRFGLGRTIMGRGFIERVMHAQRFQPRGMGGSCPIALADEVIDGLYQRRRVHRRNGLQVL